MDQKYTGTVKFYNTEKGFGFIKADEMTNTGGDEQSDVFFHFSELEGWPAGREPQSEPADRVEFGLKPSDRRENEMVATKVTLVGDEAAEEEVADIRPMPAGMEDMDDEEGEEMPMAA